MFNKYKKITNVEDNENSSLTPNKGYVIEELGLNPDNYGNTDIKNIEQFLDNYSEMLATRTSSMRDVYNNTYYQPKTDTQTVQTALNITERNAVNVAANLMGRVGTFQSCFGAPYQYLEAVDPYGRVYKDLFGLRREETWIGYDTRLRTANTDSKVFSAFIKVGMVALTNGQSLGAAIKGAVKHENGADKWKFQSWTMTYFVTENSLMSNNVNSEGETNTNSTTKYWKQGKVVPFNTFVKTALYRLIDTHTSPAVSGIEFGNYQKDKRLQKDNADLRKALEEKVENIFGEHSYPFFRFIASEETIVNETITNQIGESSIKEMLDKSNVIRYMKEMNFITGGGSADQVLGYIGKSLNDALNSNTPFGLSKDTQNMVGDLMSGIKKTAEDIFGTGIVDNLMRGNSLVYPRVWRDSYIERMLSLQIRLYSPYGDFYSIFSHILIPLTILTSLALPRQVEPSFVSFPFVMSIEVPGLFASDFAMITNITITRGGRYDAWSEASIMRGVDLTVDITAMKPMFGLPEEVVMAPDKEGGQRKYSNDIYGSKSMLHGDQTFANNLANLAGSFIISNQNLPEEVGKIIDNAFKNTEANNNSSNSKDGNVKFFKSGSVLSDNLTSNISKLNSALKAKHFDKEKRL